MSQFYDQASLVVVPSGYKAGTVYAQKPLTTDGQLAFTRTGDTATRVNSAGLIEKVRTNLYPYSQAFANAAWLTIDTTKVSTSATDPDGGTTAANITWTAGTNRYFYQDVSISSIAIVSFWVKSNGAGSKFRFFANGGTSFSADLTATSTWIRYSFSFTGTGANAIGIANASDNSAGDLLVAFAQFETGDVATDYIPTTTAAVSVGPVANVPRLDYLGSTCGKLLLEPQRTNLVTYSEQLDNAAWVKDFSGTGSVPVVTANYTTSPDGYQNADRVQFSAVGKTLTTDYSLIGQYPITLGATGTFSFYLKSLTSGNQNVLVYWGAGQGQVYVVTPQWQRFTLENCASGFAGIAFGTRGGAGFTAGGDQILDIAIWGAQLEAGAYATSYVPTLAASATRGADACSKTGISSLIGQTEGTFYAEIVRTTSTATDGFWVGVNAGTVTDWIFFGIEATGARFYVRVNNVVVAEIYPTMGVGTHKMALGYKSGQIVGYIDGVQVFSSTATFTLTSLTKFQVGATSPSTDTTLTTAAVKQALLFKTRLTNAQLAELTTL